MENNEKFMLKDNGWLYYNIAMCYSDIEMPYNAISFFQKAKLAYPDNNTTNFVLNADRGIALNYIKANQLKDAERLINKCQVKSEILQDDAHIGFNLFCFGYMNKHAKNWETAIEYFDKALEHFAEDNVNYYSSIYHKIQCIIHTRAFTKANQLLKQAKDICKEHRIWAVYFEALGYYLKISNSMTSSGNDRPIEYIETIAIPHFIKMHDYFVAIDYYLLLGKHYERLRSVKKSLIMTEAIHNIYKRCFTGDGRSD